jgi:hypothetical protein
LDYADQRYYASRFGRFRTSDPYEASGGASEPGSWNRYPYVGGDPVNHIDPNGQLACWVGSWNILDYPTGREIWGNVQCFPAAGGGVVIDQYMLAAGTEASDARSLGNFMNRQYSARFDTDTLITRASHMLSTIRNASFSDDCQTWLEQTLGVRTHQVQMQAGLAEIRNGFASNELYSSLYANSAAAGAASRTHGSLTIADAFLPSVPSRLQINAASDLMGTRIFLNPNAVAEMDDTYFTALLFHELLHNIGFIDDDLKSKFGITEAGDATDSITREVKKKCF